MSTDLNLLIGLWVIFIASVALTFIDLIQYFEPARLMILLIASGFGLYLLFHSTNSVERIIRFEGRIQERQIMLEELKTKKRGKK